MEYYNNFVLLQRFNVYKLLHVHIRFGNSM